MVYRSPESVACRLEYSKQWAKNNPEKANAANRKSYHKDPSKHAARFRLRSYGLMQDDIQDQLDAQSDVCGIETCSINISIKYYVDHDHTCCLKTPTCGKCNRGLICHGCNNSTDISMLPQYVSWRTMRWGLF